MLKDVRLYIGGKRVEWSKVPDILLTYETTDYTNPTVVKNSYSKTIKIDGTQKNNDLFNHIWKLDRVMDEDFTLFNPSQRVEYELFNNADIVSKGYAKLDSIKKEGYKLEYSITLYGGLGSFFYSLDYDINTDKQKTFSDLAFTNTSDPDNEFNFEINKETVYEAWNALQRYGSNTGDTRKWDFINFIPSYNGIPEEFDADRCLININGLELTQVRYTSDGRVTTGYFPNTITDGNNNYGLYNGYATGKMTNPCDEWEMRDLRSYLQRPCFSVRGMFDAIRNQYNNGGYSVHLDADFFKQDNPYYWDTWITLPMLKPETSKPDTVVDWDWYKDDQYIYAQNIPTELKWKLDSVTQVTGTPETYSMDVEIHATITGASADKLYLSTSYEDEVYDSDLEDYITVRKYAFGGMAIQMYGYGNEQAVWYRRQAKCGSNIIVLASKVDGQYIGKQTIRQFWSNIPYGEADINYNFGYWKKVSGSDYIWHNETDNVDTVHIQMDSNLMSDAMNIGIDFAGIKAGEYGALGNKGGIAYDSLHYNSESFTEYEFWRNMSFNNLESKVTYRTSGNMRSYQPVTKKDLFGGLNGTPCDWLLSYCKLFGLFIEKDKVDDTIYIRMRSNFYKNEIVNLEDLIDRSQNIDITPLTFESKWYNFNYAEANSKFLDRYKKDYSQDFGKQLIDTKYNFDSDEIDLIESTKFRNGLTALEKSNYFNIKFDPKSNQIPQCLFNWCTVTYYNNDDRLDTEVCLPSQSITVTLNPKTPEEYYDAMPKMEFYDDSKNPVDGDGVLVLFNGLKDLGKIDYWLSDDVEEMFIDNDKPCWLQTRNSWNASWTEMIAIQVSVLPQFTRYVTHNDIITTTVDFGYTKELYVPYYRYDINKTPTLYENFWKSFINDLYSVNTRKVDCFVALNSNDVYDFMKKFYWWDNSIWVCTKVSDYDIALDKATKCSFTKVNDIGAYLEVPTFDDYFFNFFRIGNTGNIPASGTTEELSAYFNLDSSSDWNVVDVGGMYTRFDNNYPTSGSFVVGQTIKSIFEPNYSPSPRTNSYYAFNAEGQQIRVDVTQDGYKKEAYLKVSPNSIVLPRVVTSGVPITVDSSSDWFTTSPVWIVSPDIGGGASGESIMRLSATTNESNSQRSGQVIFNNEDGLTAVLNVIQKAYANVTLEQSEQSPVYSVPWTGTGDSGIHYRLVNDIECRIVPMGNTGNFTTAESGVSYNTMIQPQSGKSFFIKFQANNSTVTRNAMFYAYYEEGNGRYSVYPTIVQLPLVQKASGNTIVEYQDKEYTSATTLGGSGMYWTATTNNSWIHLITTSGSGSDAQVEYTVERNTGAYRIGYIYITYTDEMGLNCTEIIEIHQQGLDIPFVVSPTAITATSNGGTFLINVTAPSSYTFSSSQSWCVPENLREGIISVNVAQNTGYDRTATITVTCGNQSANVIVTQAGVSDIYTLDYQPRDLRFESTGGTINITVRSNSPWTITESENDNNG